MEDLKPAYLYKARFHIDQSHSLPIWMLRGESNNCYEVILICPMLHTGSGIELQLSTEVEPHLSKKKKGIVSQEIIICVCRTSISSHEDWREITLLKTENALCKERY